MPIYEYECPEHGVFEQQRKVAESGAPGECSQCLHASPRIVSTPSLGRMERSQVRAMDRNEKSRHEPTVVKRETKAASEARPLQSAGGGYPWAIGH